jgi:hypothetical protein
MKALPSPRQQGVDGNEARTGTPRWSWAWLLGRVFDLEMAACPFCRRGSLRIIAVITHEAVVTRILRHLKLATIPPPHRARPFSPSNVQLSRLALWEPCAGRLRRPPTTPVARLAKGVRSHLPQPVASLGSLRQHTRLASTPPAARPVYHST